MFNERNNLATDEEIQRQRAIQNIVLFGNKPTTFVEKKAAAIYGSPHINVVLYAKVRKSFDVVMQFIAPDEEIESCTNKQLRKQIREYLRTVPITIGDRIILNTKVPILALHSEYIQNNQFEFEVSQSRHVNIAEFERFAFNSHTKYRYLTGTTFASYLYQNFMYSLNARTVDQLLNNNKWQARLAILLERTNFSEYVAKQVFYDDLVQHRGVVYDTKFVPKYDVNSLQHQDVVNDRTTDSNLIDYWKSVNIRTIPAIPRDKLSIFLTFPFKDGHVVGADGSITFIHAYHTPKQSVRMMVGELCNVHDIEFAIDTATRTLALDDVVYFALNAKRLNDMAIALMIIRRMVGDVLIIQQSIKVAMPTEFNILSWTKFSCNMSHIVLPQTYKVRDTQLYVSLIQDIAVSCYNKIGATIICNAYSLPEIQMGAVYDALVTDAEKFIFYTLILQEYNYSTYFIARQRLQPEFGTSIVDYEQYPKCMSKFNDTTLAERLDGMTEPLVKPSDINVLIEKCPPYKCIELYEFVNEQLNELVTFGNTALDDDQLMRYITLLLS